MVPVTSHPTSHTKQPRPGAKGGNTAVACRTRSPLPHDPVGQHRAPPQPVLLPCVQTADLQDSAPRPRPAPHSTPQRHPCPGLSRVHLTNCIVSSNLWRLRSSLPHSSALNVRPWGCSMPTSLRENRGAESRLGEEEVKPPGPNLWSQVFQLAKARPRWSPTSVLLRAQGGRIAFKGTYLSATHLVPQPPTPAQRGTHRR